MLCKSKLLLIAVFVLPFFLMACSEESASENADLYSGNQNATPSSLAITRPPNKSLYPSPPNPYTEPLPPDERAQMVAETLDVMLSLEPVQQRQVYEIFLRSARRTDHIYDNIPQAHWSEQFRLMQEEKNKALRATLTPAQYRTYHKNRAALDPYMRYHK